MGVLSDLQGGFRAGRGTVDQIFVLNEIITSRLERGLPTLTCFIDIAKAYDTVWRTGLWVKLQQCGCDVQTLDLLQLMYRNVVRRVLLDGRTSSSFDVQLGVPQGAVLSPLLYAVYINGLHEALRQAGLGLWVYGRLVPLLFYADDIVLYLLPMKPTWQLPCGLWRHMRSSGDLRSTMERATSSCLVLAL